jgi:hypothetical protein
MVIILLIQITTVFLKDKLLVEHEASEAYVRLLRVTLILFTFSFFLYLKYLRATSRTASDVIRESGIVKRKFLSKIILLYLLPVFL